MNLLFYHFAFQHAKKIAHMQVFYSQITKWNNLEYLEHLVYLVSLVHLEPLEHLVYLVSLEDLERLERLANFVSRCKCTAFFWYTQIIAQKKSHIRLNVHAIFRWGIRD